LRRYTVAPAPAAKKRSFSISSFAHGVDAFSGAGSSGASSSGAASSAPLPLRDELEEYLTEAPLVLAEEADQAFSVKGIFEYWLSKVGRCKLNPG
jgi:hypothetical protein